jgi:cytochrome oxidase Cu insertion factor (SCO1/SenC/PrrC family)
MSTTAAPVQPPATSGPSFYRWLMMVLAIVIALLALYRVTDTEPGTLQKALPKISVIPPFTLTERSGRPISNRDLAGKIWIADFVYTTCPGPCPLVTAELAKIQGQLAGDAHVQLVTFTVDPQTDTPAVLAKYADTYHADPDKWWFLTGPEKPLYALIQNGFLQAVQDNRGQQAEPGAFTVTHSTYYALMDANGVMRGVYQSQDADECKQLLHDVGVLEREAGF